MRLPRMVFLAGLLMFSAVGCCHTQCCVSSDPCNPSGCGISSGCCLTGWLQSKIAACRLRQCCHNYSWADECGCSSCGGNAWGASGDMTYGGSPGGGQGCGCSSGQSSGYAPPSAPPNDPPPVPIPVPAGPRTNEPTPAPGTTESTTFQQPTGQLQHVSVEEFHRLPGVVVSGPTSSVPTMAAQTQPGAPAMTLAPPQLSTAPRPLTNGVQQVQWVPAK